MMSRCIVVTIIILDFDVYVYMNELSVQLSTRFIRSSFGD